MSHQLYSASDQASVFNGVDLELDPDVGDHVLMPPKTRASLDAQVMSVAA
jgi:hypothetical protein